MINYSQIKICKKYLEFVDKDGTIHRTFWHPSTSEIRNQIKDINFSKFYLSVGGKDSRDERLEKYKLPAIVHTYYNLFVRKKVIPTVEDVCDSYIAEYINVFKDGERCALYKEYKPNGEDLVFKVKDLKARICRAYNSYHRELDFLIQLIEAYGDEFNFYYSFNDDYFKGVDIVVYDKNNVRYDISTYFSSKRSKDFKNLKDTSRHVYRNKQIHVLAYFDGDDKNVVEVGDAMLYDKKAVEDVYKQLTE